MRPPAGYNLLLRQVVLAASCAALAMCADSSTGPGDNGDLVETHRSILNGSVEGQSGQPLERVEVIVDFEGESLSNPSTLTDGAGEFEIVLALFNAHGTGTQTVRATVYAIARDLSGSVDAVTHRDVTIAFLPVAQDPPVTTVHFSLPVP